MRIDTHGGINYNKVILIQNLLRVFAQSFLQAKSGLGDYSNYLE